MVSDSLTPRVTAQADARYLEKRGNMLGVVADLVEQRLPVLVDVHARNKEVFFALAPIRFSYVQS